jgi:hypothetical protein
MGELAEAPSAPARVDVLRALGASKAGQGWKARCPAHEDRVASLSIASGAAGGWVLHCHAGCSPESVLSAVGLSMVDLMPATATATSRIVATYDYHDEQNRLLYQQVRYLPKSFRTRRPDGRGGWIWNLRDTRRVPYRLPELLAAASRPDPVFAPEGEADVEALVALGAIATTNVGGAGKWRADYNDALRGRYVVILPDNDAPGREHAHSVAQALHGVAAFVKVLELPGLPPKGDVSDWLAAGGTLEALLQLVSDAPEWTPAARLAPSEHTTPAPDAERPVIILIRDGELGNRPKPAALIEDVLLEGTFATIIGESGAGKSFFRIASGMAVATGLRLFDREVVTSGPVIAVIGEGHEDERILAYKRAHNLALDRNHGYAFWPQALNVLDRSEVDRFAEAIAAEAPKLLYLDTWSRMLAAGGGDENEARDVSRAVANCNRLQEQLRCAVAVVHHAGWGGTRERGSSALRGAADTVLLITRADDLITVTAEKQRDSAATLSLTLRLVPVPDSGSCVLRLASDVVHSAELTTQQQRALAVLRANFPSLGATMKDWQQATGIPQASLYRAATVLEDRKLVAKSGHRYTWTGLEPTR